MSKCYALFILEFRQGWNSIVYSELPKVSRYYRPLMTSCYLLQVSVPASETCCAGLDFRNYFLYM